MPLVSFCITTYMRPQFLLDQLQLLTHQTYPEFEVIISDNDPDQSAKAVVESLNDERFNYYPNQVNLGMIQSFNRSIERANTDYIVMITDDDPLDTNFLKEMLPLIIAYPNRSIYCGFSRNHNNPNKIEEIDSKYFPSEVLDPVKNPSIFWSNCILRKADVIKIGLIPDYGSPHLADHALLAMTGSISGGVIKNKIYSSHHQHENNYSKGNLNSYYAGCIGFYKLLNGYFKDHKNSVMIGKMICLHLKYWFIIMSFSLRRHFYKLHDRDKLLEIDNFSKKILSLDFMTHSIVKYKMKKAIFDVKAFLGML